MSLTKNYLKSIYFIDKKNVYFNRKLASVLGKSEQNVTKLDTKNQRKIY